MKIDTFFELRKDTLFSSYSNPRSSTFGNAYKSALSAGYTHETACNITRQGWFKERLKGLQNALPRAETVLDDILAMNTLEPVMANGSPTGEHRQNVALLRIKADTSKFILSTLGKDRYGARVEIIKSSTPRPTPENCEQARVAIAEYLDTQQ